MREERTSDRDWVRVRIRGDEKEHEKGEDKRRRKQTMKRGGKGSKRR